jgi:anti-sigma regulatory factor (Ser/Thr protein kinase)
LPLSCTRSAGCEPASAEDCFRHETLLYAGDDGFLGGTVPFIEGGLEAREPVLVAVGAQRRALIERALGTHRRRVGFLDMHALGRNPARIIPAWQRFLETAAPDGDPVRGIGEPIWPGRSPAELVECDRHEALLNLAFGEGRAWSLLCPYDAERLDEKVLEGARRNHPRVAGTGGARASDPHVAAGEAPGPFGGALPAPRGAVEHMDFASPHGLAPMRAWLSAWAAAAQMSADQVQQLVLAVNELASNSVCYGGGRGTLRAWREDGTAMCEVSDEGHIEQPFAGRINPTPTQSAGRGLWLVNQLCDLVQIRSSAAGTCVRVHMSLG